MPAHSQVHHPVLHYCCKAELPEGHSRDQRGVGADVQQAKSKPHSPQHQRCCTSQSPDTAGFGDASGPPMGAENALLGKNNQQNLASSHRQDLNSVPKQLQPARLHLEHPTTLLGLTGRDSLCPPYKEPGRSWWLHLGGLTLRRGHFQQSRAKDTAKLRLNTGTLLCGLSLTQAPRPREQDHPLRLLTWSAGNSS